MKDEHIPAEVFPPGHLIKHELEARGWTQEALADIMGRPSRAISEILSGKKQITPETAQGLGDAFGTGAQTWLNLESAYRLHLYRQNTPPSDVVKRRAFLHERAPIRDMIRRGWIAGSDEVAVLEQQFCTFFKIATVDEKPRLWQIGDERC